MGLYRSDPARQAEDLANRSVLSSRARYRN
jgi:hypothetical protein